jgi:SAM-dependent methyltransferase
MHPRILREFQRLAKEYNTRGPYLEVDADLKGNTVTSGDWFSKEERHAVTSTAPPQVETPQVETPQVELPRVNGITFHRGSAHDMRGLFEDKCFFTVISGAVLQHDKCFWLSLEEIKRVLAPGGVLMVAVPAFTKPKARVQIINAKGNPIPNAAVTSGIQAPPDYWRFSPQAVREVIFDDFEIKELRSFMMPPRVIGIGVKPS